MGTAEFSRRRFELFDRLAWVGPQPFERQSILVVECEDCFLAVDRRPAFHIEGMERDNADLVIALDPTDGCDVVPLVTRNPAIAMPALNPTSGVTHGPVPSCRGRYDPAIDYARGACYRVFDRPIANRRREAREIVLRVDCGEGIGKGYLRLEPIKPGGRVKIPPHQILPLCKRRGGGGPTLRNLVGR